MILARGERLLMFKGQIKKALRYLLFVGAITVVAILALGLLCAPNSPFADACLVSSSYSLWVGALLGAITTAAFFWMIESKTSEITTTLLGYDQRRAYAVGKGSAELAEWTLKVKRDDAEWARRLKQGESEVAAPGFTETGPTSSAQQLPLGHRYRRAIWEDMQRKFTEVWAGLGMQFDPVLVQTLRSDSEAGREVYFRELVREISF